MFNTCKNDNNCGSDDLTLDNTAEESLKSNLGRIWRLIITSVNSFQNTTKRILESNNHDKNTYINASANVRFWIVEIELTDLKLF